MYIDLAPPTASLTLLVFIHNFFAVTSSNSLALACRALVYGMDGWYRLAYIILRCHGRPPYPYRSSDAPPRNTPLLEGPSDKPLTMKSFTYLRNNLFML